ncbi:TPA: AP2 domain-containing protein [Enterococcus faecium]|nr:AP2 domain-containing protein [Enterococcus faecium]
MPKKSHGLTSNKLDKKCYTAWKDIKTRCYNFKNRFYFQYGARGILLDDKWMDSPVEFVAYVQALPNFGPSMSIDRVDNNKGYVEGNLRWATKAEQVRNRGKNANNTTGKCGVTWYYNLTGGTRAIAWWEDNGVTKSKSFPCKKFGLLPAFKMACEYRANMINELNTQGAGYSESHGK